jgi:hypothetical protein
MSGAVFSPDRVYRYTLTRTWDSGPTVAFIGLNPSTADETVDDPTIRRCIGFAKRWGYGTLVMLNLFAFRATDPRVMRAAGDPIGPENNAYIQAVAAEAGDVVAAWGVHGSYLGRDRAVRDLLFWRPSALGLTKDGHPRHPLYVRADATLVAA